MISIRRFDVYSRDAVRMLFHIFLFDVHHFLIRCRLMPDDAFDAQRATRAKHPTKKIRVRIRGAKNAGANGK